MGVSRKSFPGYLEIKTGFIALTFFLATLAAPARSETVQLVPAPAAVQSVGAWFFLGYINFLPSGIASLYNGYPSGQATCNAYSAWSNSLSSHTGPDFPLYFYLIPGYADQGLCWNTVHIVSG